jgi:hypothetical protein
MGIGAANRMTYWCLVLLFIDWISRREDAVVYRAGPSNQPGSLALRLWDKLDNFAHIRSKHWLEKDSAVRDQVHHKMHPNAHRAFFRSWAPMPPTSSCTPLASALAADRADALAASTCEAFCSPLVVVGKSLKLTRNRSVGHGLGV